MRLIAALGVSLIISSVQAGDIIKDKSPDGKFALRITTEDQGWGAAIINLKDKEDLVELDVYQHYTEEMHLVWSKDSQRVAYFEPDRRGGSTTVYFRDGFKFVQIELPDIPECKNLPKKGESHVKTIEATTEPQKWLASGALVLRIHLEDLMENEDNQRARTCTQFVTVAFDSNHKACVQNVKRVKAD